MPHEGYIYPGAQHRFNNDTTPRYDAAAAKLAWQPHDRLVQQVRPRVLDGSTAVDDLRERRADIVLDGKYRIEALLGQGGMGAVDPGATHIGTTRTVAVKIIHPAPPRRRNSSHTSAAKRKRPAVCAIRTWWTPRS